MMVRGWRFVSLCWSMDAQSRRTDVKFTIANETWKFLALSFCVENIFLRAKAVWVKSVLVGEIWLFCWFFSLKKCPNANKT
jgi:hypothetical protein